MAILAFTWWLKARSREQSSVYSHPETNILVHSLFGANNSNSVESKLNFHLLSPALSGFDLGVNLKLRLVWETSPTVHLKLLPG